MEPCVQKNYKLTHIKLWNVYLNGCMDLRNQHIFLIWCQEVIKKGFIVLLHDGLETFFNIILHPLVINIINFHICLCHSLKIFKIWLLHSWIHKGVEHSRDHSYSSSKVCYSSDRVHISLIFYSFLQG